MMPISFPDGALPFCGVASLPSDTVLGGGDSGGNLLPGKWKLGTSFSC